MIHTTLELKTTTDGDGDEVPVVPDAVDVSKEGNGVFVAYGDYVPGTNTKWKRGPGEVIAILIENKPGQYIVCGDKPVVDSINDKDEGKTVSEMGRDHLHYRVTATKTDPEYGVVKVVDYPVKFAEGDVPATPASKATPWKYHGLTITEAKPSALGSLGIIDSGDVVSSNITAEVT